MPIIDLICHTEGCPNQDVVLPYPDPADLCICGGCDQEITDKKPAKEAKK
jgi:hypothetical protein